MEIKLREKLSNEVKTLESTIFFWSLIVTLTYFVYAFIFDIVNDYYLYSIIQDGFLALILTIVLRYFKKIDSQNNSFRLFYCIFFHTIIHVNWILWSGYNGDMTMVYIALCVITVVILPIKYSFIILLLSISINILLIVFQFNSLIVIENPVSIVNMSFTYLIISAGIILILISTKTGYEKQHSYLHKKAIELKKVNAALVKQKSELETNKNAIHKLNTDLNVIVEQRTQELIDKGDELAEMAFVNAHLLRAPLARILGIIQLLELEKHPIIEEDQLTTIRESAAHADYIIRHINQVTSSN